MSEECEHDWRKEYYGLRCANCQLFYPDNGNYFAPLGDDVSSDDLPFGGWAPNEADLDAMEDDPDNHGYLSVAGHINKLNAQDGDKYHGVLNGIFYMDEDREEDDEEIETVICARCGEEYPAESKECTSCGLSRVGRFKDDNNNSGVPA